MEYQLYFNNSELLLEEGQQSPNSRTSWDVSPPGKSMDNGENCFEWNELKIDEGDGGDVGSQRKRKYDREDEQEEGIKARRGNFSGLTRDPLAIDVRRTGKKIVETQSG